ncbi:MAG: ABC transporter ATP-binding protein [Bdellovibrionales bacterium]
MGMINVKNFRKSFGNKIVHDNVSFFVREGECMGLVGGSGVGKSVILRSLIGLEKPDSGSIEIDGIEVTQLKEENMIPLRQKVAYVFQGGALFDSMTVFENMAYPLREHFKFTDIEIKAKISETLKELGLGGNEENLPSQLSGGMQKRLGLARALMMNPKIILYDEPTAGLDPFNTKKIQEHILKLKKKGVTSILVTHDMPTALAVCDKMVYLLNGGVASTVLTSDLGKMRDEPIMKFIEGDVA